ncbi:MAG TPA: phosphatase PAP2 family protein [Geobacteraceae bacterium]
MNRKNAVIVAAAACVAIVVSCLCLDHPVALAVNGWFLKNRAVAHYVADLPDLLFPAVLAVTCLLWVGYFYCIRRGIRGGRTAFFRLAAWTVPLAFILKSVLKQLFGRVNTRFWLLHQAGSDFRWFHGDENYSGFPSGHMAVFTAFVAGAWLYYPRLRPVYAGLLMLLGAALIATDYHFPSDVLAGACLGLLVNFCVDRCLNTPGRRN